MKRICLLLAGLLLAVLLLLPCACSRDFPESSPVPEAATPEEPAAEEPTVYNWLLGIDSPKETITYLYAEKFAGEVSLLSGGSMKINIHTDGALGSDMVLIEGCKRGTVTFVVQTTAPQVNFMPKLAVFDLPVLYNSIQDVRSALDNPDFMRTIDDIYISGGFKLLGYADQTFRVLSSNRRITQISDFQGQTIRTMDNPLHMAFWQALGATPTPLAFGDLHTALLLGHVDGQENPYAVFVADNFHRVQGYVMQTNHLPHLISLVMNNSQFNALDIQQQAILLKAAETAKLYARQQADIWEIEKINEIKAFGTEIVPISGELLAEIKQAAIPVYDQIIEQAGIDLVRAYLGGSDPY